VEKFKKLFPLLETEQIEEVLQECGQSCPKAYAKLVIESRKTDQKAPVLGASGILAKMTQNFFALSDSSVATGRPSKKRKLDQLSESVSIKVQD